MALALLHLLLAQAGVPDVVGSADKINAGLEHGPIRYIAAFSLSVNLGLFAWLMRVQALRVKELKEGNARAEKLGSLLEKHNQSLEVLDKAMSFVMAQQPRRRAGVTGAPTAPPGTFPTVKP